MLFTLPQLIRYDFIPVADIREPKIMDSKKGRLKQISNLPRTYIKIPMTNEEIIVPPKANMHIAPAHTISRGKFNDKPSVWP